MTNGSGKYFNILRIIPKGNFVFRRKEFKKDWFVKKKINKKSTSIIFSKKINKKSTSIIFSKKNPRLLFFFSKKYF